MKTGQNVAVKVVKVSRFKANPKLEECTVNEIRALGSIPTSPHIVRFIELLRSSNNYYFIYEYCADGTLEDLLKKLKRLDEQQALAIFAQLLQAFRSLYEHRIMHRDLKPTNILLHEGFVKLADFGFCKLLDQPG